MTDPADTDNCCPNCGQPAASGHHASENLDACPKWVAGRGWVTGANIRLEIVGQLVDGMRRMVKRAVDNPPPTWIEIRDGQPVEMSTLPDPDADFMTAVAASTPGELQAASAVFSAENEARWALEDSITED